MNDRAKLIARLKAILAKTEENGCTEGEALAALEKAQEMMTAHNVTAAELELKDAAATIERTGKADKYRVKRNLAMAVARFTGTRCWNAVGDGGVTFCGVDGDAQFATWLLGTLQAFVLRRLKAHLRVTPCNGSRLVSNGFVHGCCQRISERLNELAAKARPDGNGRALVVAKGALIDAKLAEIGLRTKASRSRIRYDRSSYDAGRAAGNGATFGRPVHGGGSAPLLLS